MLHLQQVMQRDDSRMTLDLLRYQQAGHLHFVTFSCYQDGIRVSRNYSILSASTGLIATVRDAGK